MQGQTSIRVLDTSTTLPLVCPLSAASAHPSISTGKERDQESGNDYFGARYYASSMGRFMSPDPFLNSGHPNNPQTWNRYTYGLNNPLVVLDPTGLYNVVDHCADGDKACEKTLNQLRANLRTGLDALQQKADGMKDGAEKDRLESALKAFGTADDDNNVFVSAGSLSGSAAAETVPTGNPDTGQVNFNVTFDTSKVTSSTLAGIDGAHEGTHIADISDPRYNNPNTTLTPFQLEYRGYQTSSWAADALGLPSLSFGGREIWNRSWGVVDSKLTQYLTDMKDKNGKQNHPDTDPQHHNPWSN
jgi:RHS repeat-associated protein